MAKYFLQNKSRSGDWTSVRSGVVVGFFIIAAVFLLLPIFQNPLRDVWRFVSIAQLAVSNRHLPGLSSANECLVVGAPPQQRFDTLLLECNPDHGFAENQFVWYRSLAGRYLVGIVSNAQPGGRVIARLFSTSIRGQFIDVRLSVDGERYSAVPIGGGSLRVEIPATVPVSIGQNVYHATSGQLLGMVAGAQIEKGSFIQRVYIRLPFSFEKLTRLEIE